MIDKKSSKIFVLVQQSNHGDFERSYFLHKVLYFQDQYIIHIYHRQKEILLKTMSKFYFPFGSVKL